MILALLPSGRSQKSGSPGRHWARTICELTGIWYDWSFYLWCLQWFSFWFSLVIMMHLNLFACYHRTQINKEIVQNLIKRSKSASRQGSYGAIILLAARTFLDRSRWIYIAFSQHFCHFQLTTQWELRTLESLSIWKHPTVKNIVITELEHHLELKWSSPRGFKNDDKCPPLSIQISCDR